LIMDAAKIGRPAGEGIMQMTMFLVLATESALFVTLVMAYLFMRGGGSTMVFTPPSASDIAIASANTVVLLGSAAAVQAAHNAIARDHAGQLQRALLLALGLGALFVAGQIFEFRHSGMSLRDFSFGGAFFALISFHATHVLAGMVVLALNLARAHAGDFTARRHVAITAGMWFWYFVVAVWIILFTVLYLI
jgi:cytochrome c oxidase subunit III